LDSGARFHGFDRNETFQMRNLGAGVGCSSGDSLSKFLRLEKVDIRYVEMPKELLDMWKSQRLF